MQVWMLCSQAFTMELKHCTVLLLLLCLLRDSVCIGCRGLLVSLQDLRSAGLRDNQTTKLAYHSWIIVDTAQLRRRCYLTIWLLIWYFIYLACKLWVQRFKSGRLHLPLNILAEWKRWWQFWISLLVSGTLVHLHLRRLMISRRGYWLLDISFSCWLGELLKSFSIWAFWQV